VTNQEKLKALEISCPNIHIVFTEDRHGVREIVGWRSLEDKWPLIQVPVPETSFPKGARLFKESYDYLVKHGLIKAE